MAKCRMLTKAGNPCQNKAVSGTNFCWLHRLTALKSQRTFLGPVVLGVVIALGVGWLYERRGQGFSLRLDHLRNQPAEVPSVSPVGAISLAESDTYHLNIGAFPLGPFTLIFEPPRIFLSGEIYDERGAMAARFSRSEIFVSAGVGYGTFGRGYDVNGDRRAFELLSPTGHPMFQAAIGSDGVIYVRFVGYLPQQERVGAIAFGCVLICGGFGTVREVRSAMEYMQPIFEYPGFENPSRRRTGSRAPSDAWSRQTGLIAP